MCPNLAKSTQRSCPRIALSVPTNAIGAEIILRKESESISALTPYLVLSDGTRSAAGGQAKFTRESDPGFLLSLATRDGAEFWTDLSILHFDDSHLLRGKEAEPAPFDFNLLFSRAHIDPVDAVQAAALANMPEAQARIVAISPPIPVEPTL